MIYYRKIEFRQKVEKDCVLGVKRKCTELKKVILKFWKLLKFWKFRKKSKGSTFVFVQKIRKNVIRVELKFDKKIEKGCVLGVKTLLY